MKQVDLYSQSLGFTDHQQGINMVQDGGGYMIQRVWLCDYS